jgi:hypothetical protein
MRRMGQFVLCIAKSRKYVREMPALRRLRLRCMFPLSTYVKESSA